MKLLTHYNRINLITTIVVLFITGIIYYGAISYILNQQVDDDLRIEEEEIMTHIKAHGNLPPAIDFKDQQVKYLLANQPVERHFVNTDFYNKKENENESGRGLITSALVNGQNYRISITESKVETEDLIRIVFLITIGVILFLLLILFITNRFILNRIWKPFYNILHQLRIFSLSDGNDIVVSPSKIDEFQELNDAVANMSARVKTDYGDLKTFTENASHELLTPIAVINSKLDSLIQTGDYNDVQSKLLNDVYSAVSRLTRLNQSLLLLVKIENQLLNDVQMVELKPLIEDKLNQFRELFSEKEVTIFCQLIDKRINISKYLADILFNNLFSNAMRHNHQHGELKVILNNDSLVIQNTGSQTPLSNNDIFKRFNKSSNSEGTGLGLTISKQICDNYKFKLTYTYDTPYHTFTTTF